MSLARYEFCMLSVMEQVLNDLQSYLYALMYAPFYDIYHLGHHL